MLVQVLASAQAWVFVPAPGRGATPVWVQVLLLAQVLLLVHASART